MSFSAHKIYGPKGIGALYIRRRDPVVRLEPQIVGGGQQEGRRSGTLNVPGIIGFAKALELCAQELAATSSAHAESNRLATLRDQLFDPIRNELDDVLLCGPSFSARYDDGTPLRLPGNLNLSFGNVDGEALLLSMGNLAVSSGAACTSVDPDPSHVLRALGLSDDAARSSLRFGLGRFNTRDEIVQAAERVNRAVRSLRGLAAAAGQP
jgi:cysteine desulfurase